ncbi:MAG: hypothetical protein GY869_09705 [Planctomycetes bacterium]|nr:hypothetical protein [Planctomycetota bacterium]
MYAVIDDGNFPAAVDYSDGPVVFHHGGPFRNLTISSSAGGSVTRPGEGVFIRFFGTPVHLAAEAKRGYRFVNWTGDVAGLANVDAAVTTIIVHGDHSIIANFVAAGAPMR